jgi:thiamine biosynthesis lipoprotein
MSRWWGAAIVAAMSSACAASPHPVERTRLAMGSELRLTAWTDDDARAEGAFDRVFAEFDRLEQIMSVWRDGSDVLRVNAAAGRHPVRTSPETIEVLRIAKEVGDWTAGKFDVTFGPLADLWKFDHDQDDRVPSADEIARRLPLIDYRAIEIDEAAGTVFLRRAGMRIHLGGIGKGYAVDRGAAIIRSSGLRDFMIQSGGDLYVGGLRDRRPWRLGIRDPRGPADRTFAVLDLSDGTFSTSGDYERFFLAGGRRYHHILDPDTGQPAETCRSVTVVSNRAVLADAVAKGIFILGPDEGMKLVERLPDLEAVIVSGTNDVLVSEGLKNRLAIVAPPSP